MRNMKYLTISICLCKTPEDVHCDEEDIKFPGTNFIDVTDVMQVIILQRRPFLLNAFIFVLYYSVITENTM